jgi:chromate reductase
MGKTLEVAAVVGSLRRESFTRRFVEGLISLAPASLKIEIVPIGELALYNQDQESPPPESWKSFRARIKRSDAVLFATPEYNRTIPGVLKNAIDVGSRPYGSSVWAGKPAAVVSTSPGALGAFGANHCVRQSLVFLDMPTLQQPEMYIGGADKVFDASGQWTNPSTRELAVKFLKAFEAWAQRFVSA